MDQDDARRAAFLGSCAIFDTPREQPYDRLIYTAAQVMRVQLASLVLIGADRVWAKALVGCLATERPRADCLSEHVLRHGELVVVEDAMNDQRLGSSARLPTGQEIRAFCATPLFGPNRIPFGTLCVMDTLRRSYTTRQLDSFLQLGRQGAESVCIRSPGMDVTLVSKR